MTKRKKRKVRARQWYGVKSLFQYTRTPKGRKKGQPDWLLEERVVLIRAKNSTQALEKAKRDIADYEDIPYFNSENEVIRCKFMGVVECYHLFDPPRDGAEVYSQINVITDKSSVRKWNAMRFGTNTKRDMRIRAFYRNREFFGEGEGKGSDK